MAGTLKIFGKGFISGFLIAGVLFGVIAGVSYFRNRDKEIVKYVELQQVIEEMREDYVNRDPVEFLDIPDVRGAVTEAASDFDRKLEEIFKRYRNRFTD